MAWEYQLPGGLFHIEKVGNPLSNESSLLLYLLLELAILAIFQRICNMLPQISTLHGVSVKNTEVMTCILVIAQSFTKTIGQSPPFKMEAMRAVSTASSSHYQFRNGKTCCWIKHVGWENRVTPGVWFERMGTTEEWERTGLDGRCWEGSGNIHSILNTQFEMPVRYIGEDTIGRLELRGEIWGTINLDVVCISMRFKYGHCKLEGIPLTYWNSNIKDDHTESNTILIISATSNK